MKRFLILIICTIINALLYSQNHYYADGQQISWSTDSASANIIVKNMEDYSQIVNNLKDIFTNSNDEIIGDDEDDNIIINSNSLKTLNIGMLISSISVKSDDIAFFTFSKIVNGKHLWLRNDMYVRLSDTTKFQQYITGLFNTYEVLSYNYEGSGEYKMVCNNESKMMQLANRLHDSTWTIYSTPDFYSDITLSSNDPHYSEQWGIKNTGQGGGTAGADVNVEKAWNFLQSAIGTIGLSYKVAVIDDGVEDHEDLYNNGISKVLTGYTANGIGNGSPKSRHKHGQACAGIISATKDNGIGITGVSPNAYIVPIRIYKNSMICIPNGPIWDCHLDCYSMAKIADAIKRSWHDYDACVLNNSWNCNKNDMITYAFQEALTSGRNGNGCIIVASSGNDYNDTVSYPSNSKPLVISVGAITKTGNRVSFSNYGQELSVVAPGKGIYTIDRMGRKGENTGNYWTDFEGTSAACPFVSGIATLILSANPTLTVTQVKNIIEQTAQRIGGYNYIEQNDGIHNNGTWHEEMGYGLVDAHKAVMQAYFYDYTINGTNTSLSPCEEYTFSLSNSTIPSGVSFSWDVSNNLEIVSEQGDSITVRPIGYGACWIKANFTHEGCTVTKTKNKTITSGYTSTIYKNYTASGTTPITIDADAVISGPFTISSGSTVTISTTVHCSPTAEFFIQPGGKLVVDGGTITNLCPDKMWRSIRVVGNSSLRQLAQNQGTLEIKNGSVISNAKDAISTWDGEDYYTTGGIVKCTNSTFHNNRRSVEFMAYTNHTSAGAETSNVSFFKDCDFIIDGDNIFEESGATYSDMITMWGVNGIDILGCNFDDQRTGSPTRGNAITLASAGANISTLCPPPNGSTLYVPCECQGEVRNTFDGFVKGINAENTGTNYPFSVFKANFDNCRYSVYSSAVNNYSTTMSDFDLPVLGQGMFSYGIYSTDCSGYTIEANDFYADNNVNLFTCGTHVQNSGSDVNTIYRNTYDKLMYGVYSSNNPALQIQCNEFTNGSVTDILASGSIGASQGLSTKSAGNKFTSGITNFSSNNTLTYYHSGINSASNEYCPYNSTASVTKVPNITVNNCEPTICINPSLPDPGIIKSASPSDDITIYNSLQQFYESRLTEYTAAGYGFLLENFDENDADIVAIARLKQDTLISLSRTMAEIANRNLNAILADSVLDRESLNGWYNRINTTTAKYSLANSYFETGEYALARQELAAIPQHFALSADELAEYDNFCDYNALRESVFSSGRNYAQLTDDEIAELEAIADLNTGVSSTYANSVLCFFYGICREIDEAEIDDTPMNNKNAVANVEENETESLAVYVYPNPADDELNILISSLPEGITTIEFHDVAGRLILSQEIASTNASINISSLKQGVYMYRIVNDDNVIARDRIVKE